GQHCAATERAEHEPECETEQRVPHLNQRRRLEQASVEHREPEMHRGCRGRVELSQQESAQRAQQCREPGGDGRQQQRLCDQPPQCRDVLCPREKVGALFVLPGQQRRGPEHGDDSAITGDAPLQQLGGLSQGREYRYRDVYAALGEHDTEQRHQAGTDERDDPGPGDQHAMLLPAEEDEVAPGYASTVRCRVRCVVRCLDGRDAHPCAPFRLAVRCASTRSSRVTDRWVQGPAVAGSPLFSGRRTRNVDCCSRWRCSMTVPGPGGCSAGGPTYCTCWFNSSSVSPASASCPCESSSR